MNHVTVGDHVTPIQDVDEGAHATIHDPSATARERGMAATILALIDDRKALVGRVTEWAEAQGSQPSVDWDGLRTLLGVE